MTTERGEEAMPRAYAPASGDGQSESVRFTPVRDGDRSEGVKNSFGRCAESEKKNLRGRASFTGRSQRLAGIGDAIANDGDFARCEGLRVSDKFWSEHDGEVSATQEFL